MNLPSLLLLSLLSADPPKTCTVTRALDAACGACVQAKCCAPPVESDSKSNMTLGCHIGCRKQPGYDGKPKTQAVIDQCVATCDQTFGALPAPYTKLVGCMTQSCATECLARQK